MTDKSVSPAMLAGLRTIAVVMKKDPNLRCVRINGATGRSLHLRNLVDKIFVANSPWDHFCLTDQGRALLEKEGLMP